MKSLTLDVPRMPGQTVTIRKLGHVALRDALWAQLTVAAKFIKAHGEDAFVREFERHGGETAIRAIGEADPVIQYHFPTLIARSVLTWDPPREAPPEGSELEAWLAREIAYFSDPQLRPKDAEATTNAE